MNRYQKYIQSEEWQAVRKRILKRANGRCEKCKLVAPKHVHHKTYARLGAERDSDLIALCVACHLAEHPDKVEFSPRPSFVGEHQCRVCPSERAEIFVGDRELLYICTSCGETDREKRRRKTRKRKRRPQPSPLTKEQKRGARWAKLQADHEASVRRKAEKLKAPLAHHWTF